MSTFEGVNRLFERRDRFIARAKDKRAALAEFKRRVHEELLFERQMRACGVEESEINGEGMYWYEPPKFAPFDRRDKGYKAGWRRRGQSLETQEDAYT
jgi:hypothetical protein